MPNRFWLPAVLISALLCPAAAADFALFEKSVRPLLVERCRECHSAETKTKGGLSLDTREDWQRGGDSGVAIVPGDPDKSLLIKAVSYHDRDLKMPPKKPLSASDVEALRQWVAMGAPDPRTSAAAQAPAGKLHGDNPASRSWWSFQPRTKPAVPEVKDQSWPRNAIDRFVLHKLEAAGLKPSADATPDMLLRRLFFDLIGLPPSLDDFASGQATKDRVADLLASPRFGERWGRHWLDITRFAESSGGGRTLPFKDAWRYRDYVIDSMNENLSLDRFITEQLAGDILPHATPAEQRHHVTATGFLVLGPTNYEEQDKQALRMDIIDEQLDTIGKSFLGMTIGCARCHDHKFDPISTKDYYAMAGILRSTRVIKDYKENVAHWIDTPLLMEGEVETELQAREAKLTTLKQELDDAKANLKKAGVEKAQSALTPGPLDPSALPGIVVDDTEAKEVGTWKRSTHTKTYIGKGYLSDDNRDKGAMTLTFIPKITEAGRYEVRFAYSPLAGRAENVPVVVFHADGEKAVTVDESEPPPIDGRFVSLGTYRFEAGGEGYVLISNSETTKFVTADAVQFLKVDDIAAAPDAKTPKKATSSPLSKKVQALTDEIKALETKSPRRPEAMSVREDDQIENCPIHIRGQTRNLGEVVPRGYLSILKVPAEQPSAKQSGRLELAAWMVHRDNPLTARVMANRVWLWLFGEGLVRTPDNFGTTGEAPSHPELLDYLANELIESGWDLKHLITLIVNSRTYQQSSNAEAGMRNVESQRIPNSNSPLPTSVDPENRLLWRQNERRMDAESLRDTMLTISGELRNEVGGPNIIDAKAVDANSSLSQTLEYNYVFNDTRRSVYTPAFRNKRHELFEAFDFADINAPIGKRNTSTVAPQALFMMNHPFVMDQATKGAARLLKQPIDDAELVRTAYQQILGRKPSPQEQLLASSFIQTSASDEDKNAARLQSVSLFLQTLFASAEFRYLK